jgi:hypothetical protein
MLMTVRERLLALIAAEPHLLKARCSCQQVVPALVDPINNRAAPLTEIVLKLDPPADIAPGPAVSKNRTLPDFSIDAPVARFGAAAPRPVKVNDLPACLKHERLMFWRRKTTGCLCLRNGY